MLNETQKWAAEQIAKKDETKKTFENIADEAGISSRTLLNWRAEEEFQSYVAECSGSSIDELLVDAIKTSKNPQLFATYYRRFGLLKDSADSSVAEMLQMSDEDRERIEREIYEKYATDHGLL